MRILKGLEKQKDDAEDEIIVGREQILLAKRVKKYFPSQ